MQICICIVAKIVVHYGQILAKVESEFMENLLKELDSDFCWEVLNSLDIGVFVLDAQGNYLYVNDCYCKMVDSTPKFFQNMSIPKLKEMGYLTVSVWEQVLQKNATVMALVTIKNIDLNQTYHHFTTGTPIFNSDGSIKYIIYMVESMESINRRIQAGMLNRQSSVNNIVRFASVNKTPEFSIVAESPIMKQLLSLLNNVAKTDASILITGPTGSGKEVLAQYTHYMSKRSDKPFICVDCASIPENLLESELFGFEKGAFTGAANQGKLGQIELANGGTLFLDEINSMPLGLQSKLLRVLETKKIRHLGGLEDRPVDFRLICASNHDLEALCREGSFRSDLYYRISVIPVKIPPLREHKEDIAPLIFHFLQYFCKKYSRMKVLTEDVIQAMLAYDWPGNVRELRNCIERIVVTSSETDLNVDTIPKGFLGESSGKAESSGDKASSKQPRLSFDREGFSFRSYMEQCEKQVIQEALAQFKSPAKAAEILGLDLSSVYRKIRKYKLG